MVKYRTEVLKMPKIDSIIYEPSLSRNFIYYSVLCVNHANYNLYDYNSQCSEYFPVV